jgi:fluoride exporter
MVWCLIGLGGALGAMARHGLNTLALHYGMPRGFPVGIFLINVSGSAAIGLLAGLLASGRLELSEHARTFLFVGVLGGFTTFSAFSLDTLTLARGKHYDLALWNALGQVALSLAAVSLAFRAGAGSGSR